MRSFVTSFLLTALIANSGVAQTSEVEQGKEVFRACRGCHNTLTDARKSGPSLRTLFGKVRLINGKRAIEQNVIDLITEGYNSMPSYRYMLRPDDWTALLSYLKTLRARPEVAPMIKPIRGSDEDILAGGKKHFIEHCATCHDVADGKAPSLLRLYKNEENPVEQSSIVTRVREGHSGMPTKKDVLDDAALFSLIAYLKAQ